jgi:hypothetical protein
MSRIKYFIFIVNLFLVIPVSSQIEYDIISINNNKETKIIDSLKSLNNKTIFFFCPILYYDSIMYKSKVLELVRSKKMSSMNNLKIHFFLFKEDPINNSKGIPFKSEDSKQNLSIGQLECFFLNCDKNLVQRARSKDKFNFEYTQPFANENLYRIQIVDTNKCFKELPERIPFYTDFIKEVYNPSYSLEEKIDFLNDSIRIMQKKIVELSLNNDLIISKLDSLLNQFNVDPLKNNRKSNSNLKNEKSDQSEKIKTPKNKEDEKKSKTANTTKPLIENKNQEKPKEQGNKANKK